MSSSYFTWGLIIIAVIAANLPWLSDRIFLFLEPKNGRKSPWWRLLEWLCMYLIIGLLATGLEHKQYGNVHEQGWEFYFVGLFLFMVFAFPGFVYRYQLKKYL